jgi:hypothetical protein
MIRIIQGAGGFILFFVALIAIGYWLFASFEGLYQLLLPIWATIFLAFATPVIIIAIRHQVRLTRVKLIELFARNFGFDPVFRTPAAGGGHAILQNKGGADISFEFVKGKYYADLDIQPDEEPTARDIPRFPLMLHADWMLLVCAIPYMIFAGFGMFLLFGPVIEIIEPNGAIGSWLFPSVLALGGVDRATIMDPIKSAAMHINVLTVAALAFAGSYFFTLRLLLRAVAVFDLSPITFLRCFAHMVLAVTLAIVIYRVVPSGELLFNGFNSLASLTGFATNTPDRTLLADPSVGVQFLWLILAFALGFLPDTALQYVLQRAGFSFKQPYTKVETYTKTVPVTIIDGIDPTMAFRLEEANIFDVQNLATFNPIMLHIESPYGIYQTIDWVAQAQLCAAVGPDRFLLLRTLNLRTIFDLEEAILGEAADPWLSAEVSKLLISESQRDRDLHTTFGFASSGREPLTAGAACHLTRMITDDLHVHRLRQTWRRMAGCLQKEVAESDHDDAYTPALRPGPAANTDHGPPAATALPAAAYP